MILLIQIAALVCFACAALGVPASRVALGWVGLFLWLLSLMLGGITLHTAGH